MGIKRCKICGKEFVATPKNKTLCSDECKRAGGKLSAKKQAEERKLREQNEKELVKYSVLAGNAGTSYGKYESRFYLAKQSEEMAKRRRELDAEWERKRKHGNQ